jgi:DNA-binding NarL/FixJ family response regulator
MRQLVDDDYPVILAGIKHALETAEDFEVVAETNNGAQVLPLVFRTQPDLALLDMPMPGVDGLTCLDRTNICRKLGVSNRTEPTPCAYEHGLVEHEFHDHG